MFYPGHPSGSSPSCEFNMRILYYITVYIEKKKVSLSSSRIYIVIEITADRVHISLFMARWHCTPVWKKYTSTPRVGVRSLATFGLFALYSAMLGYAELGGWPDMAMGHVLSRAPKWGQPQM
jgi:hypothetical protein